MLIPGARAIRFLPGGTWGPAGHRSRCLVGGGIPWEALEPGWGVGLFLIVSTNINDNKNTDGTDNTKQLTGTDRMDNTDRTDARSKRAPEKPEVRVNLMRYLPCGTDKANLGSASAPECGAAERTGGRRRTGPSSFKKK